MSIAAGRPRLAIAIPTLNRATLVSRAVESALAQTYPSIEIIVSNNGSTDNTRRVLDSYRDPRLRVIHRDTTIPATEHGNLLVDLASGEFFLGLSDDDWIEPLFVERVLGLFDRRPDLSFVWTGCVMHYADTMMPAKTGPEIETGMEFLSAFLAGERDICWCAVVTRTEDLRRVGPLPSDVICGDMFYWTKLAAEGNVGCVAEALSHYLAYRDGGDGSAGGAPVLSWAKDAARWVGDIVEFCSRSMDHTHRALLNQNAAQFLFRSTANQFVWQALRGARRLALLRTVPSALPYLRGPDGSPWVRVVASIVAPRRLLRVRMIREARRKARSAAAAGREPGS